MCNNLIFICYHLHPCTSLYILLFYPILSSIAQLYIQSFMFQLFFSFSTFCLFIFTCVFFILILFFLSVCRCCLCELEAYDTKTNSLYALAYLAIKALSDSDYWTPCSLPTEQTGLQGMKTFEQDEDFQLFSFVEIYIFFSFITALRKQQKILACFPEDKLSTIYLDLQIQKVFTPRLLMHCVSFWSISECLNLF